jgi:hypothetical protein
MVADNLQSLHETVTKISVKLFGFGVESTQGSLESWLIN